LQPPKPKEEKKVAETKGNIEARTEEEKDELTAVESVTTEVPHEADASSQPGPYEGLELDRPPVSTNKPDQPIAHSLIEGAGAPTGEPEIHPETYVADNAYVQSGDEVEEVNAAPSEPQPAPRGRPKSGGS